METLISETETRNKERDRNRFGEIVIEIQRQIQR